MTNDAAFARRFRLRRLGVRACFLAGVVVVALSRVQSEQWLGERSRGIALALGLVFLGATFPLYRRYRRYANRCPRCRQPFSEVREFDGAKTIGLPLFNTIRACPACRLVLSSKF